MHEMSIATELLAATLAAIDEHTDELAGLPDGPRVEAVEVEIGLLRQVVPEALQMAWQAATEGTPLARAALTTTEAAPLARCRACDLPFTPAIDDYLCPRCSQADVDILAGDDILLMAITCADGEG